jgi:hypothetical protein
MLSQPLPTFSPLLAVLKADLCIEGYVGMAIVGSAVIGFIAAATMWARRRG